jgi:hypothetical protein
MHAACLTCLILLHMAPLFLFEWPKSVVQSNHNYILINVKLLHVSFKRNHHQADISVHGHDIFSVYSTGSLVVFICSVEFQTYDNKLPNI